ncbi:glycosyltransferase [Actinocrinis puniceicyclus]|uniref:Glycosyltransferase n=1 Tax=Actinocrinis puniceicyclus TaxID=977794 RepID=A0A8J7WU59_9ACTN|nr:glycosyltransferase [Actinocrinis puniceicyclus]MBS2966047.1 glycosyltransferase [Actinocrinis puniceicyclus]
MPDSRAASGRLAVTTPWHPTPQRPFAGSFVQATTAAVAGLFERVDVYDTEDWVGPADPIQARLVRRAYAALTSGPNRRVAFVPRWTDEGYWVTDIPAPVTPKRDYAAWAQSHETSLRQALADGPIDADVVHGHVGIYGGWLACRFARPGARIVVTEHASFLGRILGQPRSHARYAEVVERADAFLCVSERLRQQLIGAFAGHAAKFEVVPNAVPIEQMPLRPEPVTGLNRWIYVGKITAAKGVSELVEAFAVVARDEPALTLTLLGSGPLVEPLRARAAELRLADRIAFHDAVPPQRVFEFLHAHDLLVHPSKSETFGMTLVEAVGSGMPVLVTRCGGPQETLAGLDGAAGLLIEVSDDPEVIVNGYRRLLRQAARLDPDRARAALIDRFGTRAVAARLAAVYGVRETEKAEGRV